MTTKAEHAHPVVAVLFLIVVAMVAAPVCAQEEPTPVPEPAQEEPTAKAEASEPADEPEIKEAEVPIVYRDKTQITINGLAEMNGDIELVVQPRRPAELHIHLGHDPDKAVRLLQLHLVDAARA